ncbi:hypothetical protein R5M92_13465 [Halomonas sp. Bachu 37]|uniref:hypothetical protein n=1 Tax=Halomonas kashgarensis TaxID=3084920 RepID=UPI0032174405
MSFKVLFESSTTINLKIEGGFDNPKNELRVSQDELFVSGWFYLPYEKISIIVKSTFDDGTTSEEEHFLNIYRPDVTDHLGLSSKDLTLGFQFIAPLLNVVKVEAFIKIANTCHKAWTGIKLNLPSSIAKNISERCWQEIHHFQPTSNYKFDDSFFIKIKDRFKIYSENEFDDLFKMEYPLCEINFHDFVEQFKKEDWALRTIMNLKEGEVLEVKGFISNEIFTCRASFIIDDMNFLFFSNNKDCFYLIQYTTNISLFFPIYFGSLVLEIDPLVVKQAHSKLPKLFKKLANMGESLLVRKKCYPTFLGLLLANYRPYHFFYDYMCGLNSVIEKTHRTYKTFGIHGMDFFPKDTLPDKCIYASESELRINSMLAKNNQFLIMPCILFHRSNLHGEFKSLSSKIIKNCSYNLDSNIRWEQYDLVIWIGVSTEKRSWIEQIRGYSSIIRDISVKYNNLLVLVDGRTFPQNPQDSDITCKEKEDSILSALISENKEVNFLSMIGLQSSQKIFLASKIDFFISSYQTDSMYPSAICAKPGVVYIAPTVTQEQKSLHIHHKIIEVPSEKIKEIRDINHTHQSWHELSVSMDWRDVYECVLKLIDKYEIRK